MESFTLLCKVYSGGTSSNQISFSIEVLEEHV